MAEARQRDNWNHTSHLLAGIVNANPFRKGRAATPADFDPFARGDAAAAAGDDDVIHVPPAILKKFLTS